MALGILPGRDPGRAALLRSIVLPKHVVLSSLVLLSASMPPTPSAAQTPAAVPADSLAPAGDPTGGAAPTLTGSWVLNEKASDDPVAALRSAFKKSGEGPGGRRGPGMGGGMGGPGGMGGGMGGGGMGGGGGGMGGPGAMGGFGGSSGGSSGGPGGGSGDRPGGGPDDQTGNASPGLRLKQEIAHLEIFQQGDEFNVTDGLEISRVMVIGGEAASVWTDRGEVKAVARWEKGELVEEWQPQGRGAARTRRYALTEDGRQLIVLEKRTMPGQDGPLTVKLVYDRRP